MNIIITESQLNFISEQSRSEYLKWKRKNVTLRGVKELGKENGGMGKYGSGLYTAFLSNKSMAKEYGKVYFVLNAVPKKPKVVDNTNEGEMFLQNVVNNWCKKRGLRYDPRIFDKETTIKKEVMNLGYDGIVIKGREMVNFDPPENVLYFENERQVEMYYEDNIVNNK